jgi:hypothetical protein
MGAGIGRGIGIALGSVPGAGIGISPGIGAGSAGGTSSMGGIGSVCVGASCGGIGVESCAMAALAITAQLAASKNRRFMIFSFCKLLSIIPRRPYLIRSMNIQLSR